MPNYGRSGRCLTCKRRRVKCDEARPACSPCRRLGLDCGGYTKDYAFRDESHRFASAATLKILKEQAALGRHSSALGEPSRSLLTGADVAVPFFLIHYAGMGRRLAVARGFYETLIPMLSTAQSYDSPLSLAVSAVAARVFSLWRHEDAAQAEPHLRSYTQAVASLRSALERPEDCCRPSTVLAVLALHLFESISAVYDARQATPVHHHGALSLLPIAALDSLDCLTSRYVKGFVLHTEISSALRQKRSMHPNAYSYVNTCTSPLVPGNLSSTLDSIGASIAELQADYVRGLSRQHASGPLLEQQYRAWVIEARQIEELLWAWAEDVPGRWRPLRLTSGEDFSPSIAAYRSACDIYPSCQIATLWNLWRFHRLLLLKITVGATQCISTLARDESAGDQLLVPKTMESAMQPTSIQELVDGICHSIPFYLGNRTKQSSISDFTDPDILFPSYHLLTPGDARIAAQHQDCDDIALSGEEHHRHIVAYGAWHAVSPLSNLLTLVLDDHGRRLVASYLRPGQQEWIREQFLRVSTLVRLPVDRQFGGKEDRSTSLLSVDRKAANNAAESLAKQVRKGAIFMSGP